MKNASSKIQNIAMTNTTSINTTTIICMQNKWLHEQSLMLLKLHLSEMSAVKSCKSLTIVKFRKWILSGEPPSWFQYVWIKQN